MLRPKGSQVSAVGKPAPLFNGMHIISLCLYSFYVAPDFIAVKKTSIPVDKKVQNLVSLIDVCLH